MIPRAAIARTQCGKGWLQGKTQTDELTDFMNKDVRKRLNLTDNVMWGSQAAAVFNALKGDFMRDVIDEMGWLLDQGLPVTVCTPIGTCPRVGGMLVSDPFD